MTIDQFNTRLNEMIEKKTVAVHDKLEELKALRRGPPPPPAVADLVADLEANAGKGMEVIIGRSIDLCSANPDAFRKGGRGARETLARRAVCYVARIKLHWSLPAIAAALGLKSHASVIRAVDVFSGEVKTTEGKRFFGRTMAELFPPDRGSRPTAESVIQSVATYYGLKVCDVMGRRVIAHIVRARHVAMLLVCKLCAMSKTAVGLVFLRDHTTVIHGCQRASTHPDLLQEVAEIIERINAVNTNKAA